MGKAYERDLDEDDRLDYRQHIARTMMNSKKDVTFEDAVDMELDFYEFMSYLIDKYEIDPEEDYEIDHITGKVYYWDQERKLVMIATRDIQQESMSASLLLEILLRLDPSCYHYVWINDDGGLSIFNESEELVALINFANDRVTWLTDQLPFDKLPSMIIFEEFTDWWNNDVGADVEFGGDDSLALDQSFTRHFVEGRQKPGVRMSNLGKPAVITALMKLGYTEPDPKGKLRYIFYLGDVFENTLEYFLKSYGFTIVSSQGQVKWKYNLTGHYDFIVEKDGQQVLVEAKTMSANYSRVFQQNPNDDRGYLTQMALYQNCLQLPSVWLCLDKGSGEMFSVDANPGILYERLLRAENVLKRLQNVRDLSDVLTAFKAPPPRPEIFKGEPSGKYLLPQSIAYSPFTPAIYKLSQGSNGYGKPTTYVDDVADTEYMRRQLEVLVQEGVLLYARMP